MLGSSGISVSSRLNINSEESTMDSNRSLFRSATSSCLVLDHVSLSVVAR